MTAYVKAVLENSEVVKFNHDNFYNSIHCDVCEELEADTLSLEEIENISNIEHKLYAYLKNQDVNLLSGKQKYTTALVSYPNYKAVNLESYLLKAEKSNERLFSLSHEIGHFLDMKFNHEGDAEKFQDCYMENMGVMELVAWSYAWNVLEALGCTTKDEFMKLAFECLKSYVGVNKAINYLMDMENIVKKYEEKMKEKYEK